MFIFTFQIWFDLEIDLNNKNFIGQSS